MPGAMKDLVNNLDVLKIVNGSLTNYNGSREVVVSLNDGEGNGTTNWKDNRGIEIQDTKHINYLPTLTFTQGSTQESVSVKGFDSCELKQRVGDVLILDGNF